MREKREDAVVDEIDEWVDPTFTILVKSVLQGEIPGCGEMGKSALFGVTTYLNRSSATPLHRRRGNDLTFPNTFLLNFLFIIKNLPLPFYLLFRIALNNHFQFRAPALLCCLLNYDRYCTWAMPALRKGNTNSHFQGKRAINTTSGTAQHKSIIQDSSHEMFHKKEVVRTQSHTKYKTTRL